MKRSKLCASLTPYVAGEQPKSKVIKLNTNENPYPPSPSLKKVLHSFDVSVLRKYPDPTADELRSVIAEKEGVGLQNIFVGNGSDEVLAFAFRAYFDSKSKPILFPDVTYSFYKVYSSLYEINYTEVPTTVDFKVNVDDYMGKDIAGIVIANPNAPTALSLGQSEIVRLLDAYPDNVLLLDEAYVDFSEQGTLVELTKSYDNLLVVKTFSKSRSMAGARLGYAVGNADLIDSLRTVKNCFNSYCVNSLSAMLGIASMRDEDYFIQTKKDIIKTREWTMTELKKLGFVVTDSDANFVFARSEKNSGAELQAKLREKGIVIRRFDNPKIADWLRITIGTRGEMRELARQCEAILL